MHHDTSAEPTAPIPGITIRTIPEEDEPYLMVRETELRTLNEELQMANEEFLVINEELQSVNAELQSVNTELSRKIVQLDRANDDLANLFASTQIPVIFLDTDGRISRFTPQAAMVVALIESDIGRPISDLTMHFSEGNLQPQISQVLQSFTPIELVVHQPTHERWWNVHIRPYCTLANTIDGVVLTFADITTLKHAEALLQDSHNQLEQRVAERTQDLEQTNAALQAQIVERVRSERAREQLFQQLVTAQEEERRRIARELHDQLGQDLTALILGLKALQSTNQIDSCTTERIAQLQAMAVQIGEEVRTLAVQLRPSVLDDLGLVLALTNYVEQWSVRTHIAVDLHSSGLNEERLPLVIETTIYRLVQEALTNVLKHAQASEVSVILERRRGEIRLIIEDDGVGFVPQTNVSGKQQFGLIGMQERLILLNGKLAIESTQGNGTTIFARIPLPSAYEEESDANLEDPSG